MECARWSEDKPVRRLICELPRGPGLSWRLALDGNHEQACEASQVGRRRRLIVASVKSRANLLHHNAGSEGRNPHNYSTSSGLSFSAPANALALRRARNR